MSVFFIRGGGGGGGYQHLTRLQRAVALCRRSMPPPPPLTQHTHTTHTQAHSIGALGASGRGVCEQAGVDPGARRSQPLPGPGPACLPAAASPCLPGQPLQFACAPSFPTPSRRRHHDGHLHQELRLLRRLHRGRRAPHRLPARPLTRAPLRHRHEPTCGGDGAAAQAEARGRMGLRAGPRTSGGGGSKRAGHWDPHTPTHPPSHPPTRMTPPRTGHLCAPGGGRLGRQRPWRTQDCRAALQLQLRARAPAGHGPQRAGRLGLARHGALSASAAAALPQRRGAGRRRRGRLCGGATVLEPPHPPHTPHPQCSR